MKKPSYSGVFVRIKHRMKKFGTLKDSINRRMGTSQIQEIQRKKGKRDDFC